GASLVSPHHGAGDKDSAARAAGNAFAVFWTTATVVAVGGLLAREPLLRALGASGETLGYARDYATILIAGALFATGFSSLVRAEGRMRFSTFIWVTAIAVQIALDPVLIFGFDMGVRGAAIGTVCGQAVSAAMAVWFFFLQRRRPYRIRLADLRFHGPTVRALFHIGAPSFLAGLGATLLVVLVNNGLAHSGGATALAAFAVCARVQTVVMMPQLGISQGLQPVVGFNAGRGRFDRVRRAEILTLRATLLYGAVLAAVVTLLAEPLVGVFIEGATARTAAHALRIIAVGFAVAGVAPLVSAYFQALGRATPSYLISIGTLLAVKIPLVLALGLVGTNGIWAALAAGEVTSALIALAILRHRRPAVS
ncbi:MATE family efflux transporter, partial [Actinoplanes sp. NPDC051633]|uniref:MATE family efflux transporter n=1 Tax=Actinoplanes sp. NPDC051633 TaxID=3155670 RepID=UPI0034196270